MGVGSEVSVQLVRYLAWRSLAEEGGLYDKVDDSVPCNI